MAGRAVTFLSMSDTPAQPPGGEADATPSVAPTTARKDSLLPQGADEPSQGRFGMFGGVFTPCVLTILGVIMFMRAGFVGGYAGLWLGLTILGIAKLITTLTTLSLSAIATNQDVKVGGVYYMISRVLGPDFGGSIGITLFIAQAVSVAFYVIGFTEAVFSLLNPLLAKLALLGTDAASLAATARIPQIIASIVVLALFVLTFKGADVAIKAQYVVLGILLLAIASYIVGGLIEFDSSTFAANTSSRFTPEVGFWTAFAIYFPAATGITAGANMSGDLKNPARAIPWGTLLAILFAAGIYALQFFLMAGACGRGAMQNDPFGALQRMSLWGPLIVVGVFAATLSSAIGSFLGAPRILQAMGQDRLMNVMVFFGKGSGKANEPRRATVLTFIIAVGIIWAGDLNAVAEIISMFFLIAYGMINLSAFVESKGGNPSFRPQFKLFHWTTALAGAVGCVVAMVKINETYALVAIVIVGLLYFYLRKRDIQTSWGDAKRGYIFQRTRDNLLYLESSTPHPKNWRPILAVVSNEPESEPQLMQAGAWIESQRGILTIAQIMETPGMDVDRRVTLRKARMSELRRQREASAIVGFSEVVTAESFQEGLTSFLQSYSIGGLRPNTVMTSLPPLADDQSRNRFFKTMEVLAAFDHNLLLFKPGIAKTTKHRLVIDLWWRGEKNGSLMAIIAYLVTLNRVWSHAAIRTFRIVGADQDPSEAQKRLEELARQARLKTQVNVISSDENPQEIIRSNSAATADLVFLGVSARDISEFKTHLPSMEPLLAQLPTTILVWSNGEANVFV
jgi:amino acid transporter